MTIDRSPSLNSQFPTVEMATITAILYHDFCATDLFELDSRYQHKTGRQGQILTFTGTSLELAVAKGYKSLESVSVPLGTYFSILLASAPVALSQLRSLGRYFLWYQTHLLKISSGYEWSAVLAYHTDFFNTRRREMAEGVYTGWGRVDRDLHGEHLLARPLA
ncbi:hypothetical protein FIBSPDRAFT_956743 [Athelia psychrophila]|uniref:Uncharacterized protein n=1 Tax=Athelia psychrophila TaxID=1759441 RepID=A0A166GMZ8_9AGAM|nr:hypothetical protein FIBSPDRAFT_956743 [Fibularhizoctonia sp. CBS 109695]